VDFKLLAQLGAIQRGKVQDGFGWRLKCERKIKRLAAGISAGAATSSRLQQYSRRVDFALSPAQVQGCLYNATKKHICKSLPFCNTLLVHTWNH
jgi:hypothetical protein